jgi:hypothetical protein
MGVEFASLPAHKLFQIEVELPLKIPSPTDLELVSWAIKAKAWALRPDRVVDEGQEQILPDIAHGRLGKPARANDSHQIAFQQGDAGAFDCNIGASSQCNPDFGGRERRSVNEVG